MNNITDLQSRIADLEKGIRTAIRSLTGYAQEDYDSWTNSNGDFDCEEEKNMNAEAWAEIENLKRLLPGEIS